MPKCPGQDLRFWKPGDIFELSCPACGQLIEFFKDDFRRPCPNCGQVLENSRRDTSCACWCSSGGKCDGAG